jgi:hypothetical protein
MIEMNQHTSVRSADDIRIVRLKGNKIRETAKEKPLYQVFFELSETPTKEWSHIFDEEWKGLHTAIADSTQEANVVKEFLVIVCPLLEIGGVYLPVLKKTVDATNRKYNHS